MSEQIGMGAGVGERENEDIGFNLSSQHELLDLVRIRALSSASVRNVMLVIIYCTPLVNRNAVVVPYIISLGNAALFRRAVPVS